MTTTEVKGKVRITESSTGLVIGSTDEQVIDKVYELLAPLSPIRDCVMSVPNNGSHDIDSVAEVVGADYYVTKKKFINKSYISLKTNNSGEGDITDEPVLKQRNSSIKHTVASILELANFEVEVIDNTEIKPFAVERFEQGNPAMAFIMVENDCITIGCRDVFLTDATFSVDVDDVTKDFKAALRAAANVLGANEEDPERPKKDTYTLGVTVSGATVYGVIETKRQYHFDQIKVAARAVKEALVSRKYTTVCERAQRVIEPIDL